MNFSPPKHVEKPAVANTIGENAKGPLQSGRLVCPFCATIETWWCNMVDSVEEKLLCRYKWLIRRGQKQVIIH